MREPMRALMLAAGRGTRLGRGDPGYPPKVLLRFDGKSLLQRHIEVLRAAGLAELVLVVGYRHEAVLAELDRIGAGAFVRPILNPDFQDGAVVSLAAASAVLRDGRDVLFMDGDVLYDPALIERLIATPHPTCYLLDRNIDDDEDPVRICIRDGRIAEFGKQVTGTFDLVGEWPGFARLSGEAASRLADVAAAQVAAGQLALPYEPAMREVLLGGPAQHFGYEDITGCDWIEIDFPEDLERARETILPRLRGSAATAA
ncbi:MAG: NTP transferase domain-containing protein [Dongiaceae bacterium]